MALDAPFPAAPSTPPAPSVALLFVEHHPYLFLASSYAIFFALASFTYLGGLQFAAKLVQSVVGHDSAGPYLPLQEQAGADTSRQGNERRISFANVRKLDNFADARDESVDTCASICGAGALCKMASAFIGIYLFYADVLADVEVMLLR